jgi:hypothetical protein
MTDAGGFEAIAAEGWAAIAQYRIAAIKSMPCACPALHLSYSRKLLYTIEYYRHRALFVSIRPVRDPGWV